MPKYSYHTPIEAHRGTDSKHDPVYYEENEAWEKLKRLSRYMWCEQTEEEQLEEEKWDPYWRPVDLTTFETWQREHPTSNEFGVVSP